MSAARVFQQLTALINDSRISEEDACKLLERSGVIITCGKEKGTYSKGMLKVGAGIITLDPLGITAISFPEPVQSQTVIRTVGLSPELEKFTRTLTGDTDLQASDPDVVDLDS